MLRVIGNDQNLPRQEHAVASGALTNGKAVVVNTDGTVSAPFSATTIFAEENAQSNAIATDGSGTFVLMYAGPANSYTGTVIAGTISGGTVTLGTAGTYASESNIPTQGQSVVYDPDSDKFILVYSNGGLGNYLASRVVTVSGTSVSLGTEVVIESRAIDQSTAVYDTSANKVVCIWSGGHSSYKVAAAVGTVSGTDISWGTTAILEDNRPGNSMSVVYDSNANRSAVFYRDYSNNDGYYIVCAVSGTSISGGSRATFAAADTHGISATYDSTAQKIVIAFTDVGNSSYGSAIVGTIDNSDNTMSFGSEINFSGTSGTDSISAQYDSTNNKTFIFFDKANGAMTGIIGTVSGTSISVGTEVGISSSNIVHTDSAFDSSAGKVLLVYKDVGNSNYGTLQALDTSLATSNFTSENYIGITRSGAASGAGAIVDTQGAIADNLSGLTAGQSYFVQNDGTLGTTADDPSVFAGTAVSATKLIVKG